MSFLFLFPPVMRSLARSLQLFFVLALLLLGDSLSPVVESIGSMKLLRSELPFPSFTAPEWHDSSPTFSHLSVSHLTASPDLPPKPPDPPDLLYSRYYLSMESFVHLLRPETLCSYHLPSTSLECYGESLPTRLAGDLASTDHVIAVGCCFDGNFRRMAVTVASDPGGKSTWAAGPIMQIRVSCLILHFGLWPCNLPGLGPCITYGLCFCLPCCASTAALTTERYIITDKERLISFSSPDWERFVPALPLSRKGCYLPDLAASLTDLLPCVAVKDWLSKSLLKVNPFRSFGIAVMVLLTQASYGSILLSSYLEDLCALMSFAISFYCTLERGWLIPSTWCKISV